eukprot:scpid61462/ scgid33430/ 
MLWRQRMDHEVRKLHADCKCPLEQNGNARRAQHDSSSNSGSAALQSTSSSSSCDLHCFNDCIMLVALRVASPEKWVANLLTNEHDVLSFRAAFFSDCRQLAHFILAFTESSNARLSSTFPAHNSPKYLHPQT